MVWIVLGFKFVEAFLSMSDNKRIKDHRQLEYVIGEILENPYIKDAVNVENPAVHDTQQPDRKWIIEYVDNLTNYHGHLKGDSDTFHQGNILVYIKKALIGINMYFILNLPEALDGKLGELILGAYPILKRLQIAPR